MSRTAFGDRVNDSAKESGHPEASGHLCPICSAPTHEDRGRMTVWLQDDLVVIDDVPARVCGGCGETFYDESIVAKVERLQTGGDRPSAVKTLRAPVYRWEDL